MLNCRSFLQQSLATGLGLQNTAIPRTTLSAPDRGDSNEELLAAWYSVQDRAAFNQLCNQLYAPLLWYAFERLSASVPGRREEAENLVQETLFRIWRTQGRPAACWNPQRGLVITWAQRIVLNLVISHARTKKGKERLYASFDVLRSPPTTSPKSEQAHFDKEQERTEMWTAINRLPSKCRDVLSLKLQNRTQREIAGLCKMTDSAVHRCVVRATRELRKLVG